MGFWGTIARVGLPIAASLIPGVGAVAGPAAAALLNGVGKKPAQQQPQDGAGATGVSSPMLSRYDQDFQRRLDAEGARGDRLSGMYESGLDGYSSNFSGFDPQQYLRQATAGVAADLNEQTAANRYGLKLSNNARGVLNSGMGQGRIQRDLNQRIATASNNLAFQAAGLDMNRRGALDAADQWRLSSIGGYGERARDTALEGSFDRYATERATLEEERNRRAAAAQQNRSTWGSIGGAALGAAGTALAGYLSRPR